jgi:hypothetical protein
MCRFTIAWQPDHARPFAPWRWTVDIDSPDCSELGGFAPNPVEAISRAMTSLTECGVSLRDGAGIDVELADHYRTTGTQPRNSDYPTFSWTEPFWDTSSDEDDEDDDGTKLGRLLDEIGATDSETDALRTALNFAVGMLTDRGVEIPRAIR